MTHPAPMIREGYMCECGYIYSKRLYNQVKEDKCCNPHCRSPLANCTLESGEFYPYMTVLYYDDTYGTVYKDWRDL